MADFKLGRLKFVWKGAWTGSTAYVKDDIVSYGGNAFVAEEAFTSNANFYTDLDAGRWTKIAGGTEWKNTWTSLTFYKVDDLVKYGGTVYRCNTGHTSSSNLDSDSAKWDVYAEGFDHKTAWNPSNQYKLNDVVKVGGYTYVCNNEHSSSSTFDLDSSNWDILVEGTNYRNNFTSSTRYEIGDVVTYGGYLYICTTAHTSTSELSTSSFAVYLKGQANGGEFQSSSRVYKTGEIVRYGGRSYICIQSYDVDVEVNAPPFTGPTVNPTNTNYWSLVVKGFDWTGTWTNTTEYKLDDVVEYATNSYICVQAHNSAQDAASSVTPGSDAAYWNLMSQGDSNAVVTTRGDLIIRDASQITRLPIGPAGSFLYSDGNEPKWGHQVPQNDYYVSPQGDDANDGRTPTSSWKTIRHAANETFSIGQCRINVASGTYTEQCPIKVGRSVVIEGNGLGAVTISPDTTNDNGFGTGISDDGSTPNANSEVFQMNNGARLRNFVFRNFSTGSVQVALDPGTGPADTSVWITSQSPYVQNCTNFTPGGTGFKIDGALHNGGYKSMVANDFTQINSDGIGIHALNDGRTEIVSCFTYYCNIGYLAESGAKIRGIVGNNSYGEYGAVARGYSQSETPKTGKFRLPAATVKSIQTIGNDVVINRTFVDEDKNVYMVGFTGATLTSGNRPVYDVTASKPYVAKYDTGGNLLFQSTYDGLFGQLTSVTQIDTQIYCGGTVRQSGTDKGFLLKITANGDIQWQKTLAATTEIKDVATDGTRLFAVGDHDTYGGTLVRIPAGGASVDFARAIDFNDSSLNTLVPTAIAYAGDATESGATYTAAGDADAANKLFITFNDTTNNNCFIGRFSPTSGSIETSYQYGTNLRLHDLDIDTGNGDGIYMIATGYYSDPGYSFPLTNITYAGGTNATYVSASSNSTLMSLATSGNSPSQISDITRDRKLIGVSSGAIATIVSYDGINGSNAEITITTDSGTFLDGEQIQLYQAGQPMPFIMRVNMAGVVQWQHSLRNEDGGEFLAGFGVGDVVYGVGYSITNLGGVTPDIRRDAVIAKYSSNGTLEWQKKLYNSNTGEFSEFNGVGVDGVNVIATGYTSNNNTLYFNSERDGGGPGTITGVDFTYTDAGMTENTNSMAGRSISLLDDLALSLTISDTSLTLNTSTGLTNTVQATREGFTGIGRGITFTIDELSGEVKTGSVLQIAGDTQTYFVLDVSEFELGDSSNAGTAIISIDPPIVVTKIPADQTNVTFREAFSQVRMSGHDFLDIGTGGFADTNYPVIITGDYTQQPDQTRETLAEDGGRVFYVTTDQDGNFRVGDYFKVEQSTGRATLSSEEFDLTGLNELQLGSVRAGKKGATVDEFSTDGTMADNSDTAVPTEKAVVTYVTDQLNAGGAVSKQMQDADIDTKIIVDSTTDGTDNIIRMTANGVESFNVADQYILIPTGTTAQRPSSPAAGMLRFNTDTSSFEAYQGTTWAPVGGFTQIDVATSTTVSSFQQLWIDTTSGPVTVTLPASPNKGDAIRFLDVASNFDTNALTVARNGKPIMGDSSADLTVNTVNASFDLIFHGDTYGWRLFSI